MYTEPEFNSYFDLTLHRKKAEELINKIANEGFSQCDYSKGNSIYPNMFTFPQNKVSKLPSANMQNTALEAIDSVMGLLPMIRVKETNGVVSITGIPTKLLVTYIYKQWKTSRIANNIILEKGMRYFKFYSFYAIEIIYMLQKLANDDKLRRSMLIDIITAIKENTWLAEIDTATVSKFDYSRLNELNCTLLPSQMDYLKEYEEKTQKYSLDGYVLAAPPGTGKALKNGTLIQTIDSWEPIETLVVGDKVMGADGYPTTVVGVYPQGEVELYEITFIDGRKITACKDHLWYYYNSIQRTWQVGNTSELIAGMNNKAVCFIPLVKCNNLPLINKLKATLADSEVTVLRYNNSLRVTVQDEATASNLCNDARAIGSISSVTVTDNTYQVSIRHSDPALLGFGEQLITRTLNLAISKIRPVDNDHATCISVDNSDKLFVAEQYIVTHNTINGYGMSLVSNAETTIFIVPNNSVEDVWETTLLTRFKRPKSYWTSHQKKPIQGNEDYIIGHYESLKTIIDALPKIGNRKVYVWLDESHNFNEITASRTKLLVQLCQSVNLVGCTWASGTPFKAIGKEAVPMLRCIDKQFTPAVEDSFIRIFGATKGQALDILGNRMGKVMFKVPKTNVVNNERVEYVHLVTFAGMQEFTLDKISAALVSFIKERQIYYSKNMPEYETSFNNLMDAVRPRITDGADQNRFTTYLTGVRKMHKSFSARADMDLVIECNKIEREVIYPLFSNVEKREFKRVASVYKYVILTVRGEALGRILTRARIDCFKAMVPNAQLKDIIDTARKKTLIFTSYVEVADAIKEQAEKDGFKPLIVYGDTNKNLPAIMNQFKTDHNANPLIATFDSLSTAVPVIEASTVVMFNAPFRDYIRDQAVSRADRLGQDGAVTIANVLLDTGTVENISTRSKDIMQWSKEQVDAIMQLD